MKIKKLENTVVRKQIIETTISDIKNIINEKDMIKNYLSSIVLFEDKDINSNIYDIILGFNGIESIISKFNNKVNTIIIMNNLNQLISKIGHTNSSFGGGFLNDIELNPDRLDKSLLLKNYLVRIKDIKNNVHFKYIKSDWTIDLKMIEDEAISKTTINITDEHQKYINALIKMKEVKNILNSSPGKFEKVFEQVKNNKLTNSDQFNESDLYRIIKNDFDLYVV
ncbi:hypothetical protein [Flammeovirga pacifica]|uniref:Uncharacterized protein n=1 Tax=Flammeovirga pacifica TaxID=915059 RepID=A0A1S1Z0C9_FLAPC|nr:hypothetical protein [Flammeovirga pacifica]OHX66724.1 hypothetical protein NH26_10325 [Flammeovirga pacifica]